MYEINIKERGLNKASFPNMNHKPVKSLSKFRAKL